MLCLSLACWCAANRGTEPPKRIMVRGLSQNRWKELVRNAMKSETSGGAGDRHKVKAGQESVRGILHCGNVDEGVKSADMRELGMWNFAAI